MENDEIKVFHKKSQTIIILNIFPGAGLSALYSSIFPDRVDRLVLLDLINIGPSPITKQVRKTRQAIQVSKGGHRGNAGTCPLLFKRYVLGVFQCFWCFHKAFYKSLDGLCPRPRKNIFGRPRNHTLKIEMFLTFVKLDKLD